jgi:hypothetical protein
MMATWVERLALLLFMGLTALLSLAWTLETLLRRAAQALDGFVSVADRFGEVGAAWQRLRIALRRAHARWRSSRPSSPSSAEAAAASAAATDPARRRR